jgi:hypothetical protein
MPSSQCRRILRDILGSFVHHRLLRQERELLTIVQKIADVSLVFFGEAQRHGDYPYVHAPDAYGAGTRGNQEHAVFLHQKPRGCLENTFIFRVDVRLLPSDRGPRGFRP